MSHERLERGFKFVGRSGEGCQVLLSYEVERCGVLCVGRCYVTDEEERGVECVGRSGGGGSVDLPGLSFPRPG